MMKTLILGIAMVALYSGSVLAAEGEGTWSCTTVDGRSVSFDDSGDVVAPAELTGWRYSDKDGNGGMEIYKRGSKPRQTIDLASCN